MTTALAPFAFAGQQVRVVTDEDGEPWFVAADVCAVLELAHVGSAVRGLADDERGVRTEHTLGGPQQVTIVSEAGLYRLIFTSRKVEAEAFRRWVTHEVLPTIRKTGGYGVPSTAVAIPRTYAEALRAAADEAERADVAEAKVAELAPKAELADTFLIADGSTRLVGQVAKLLGQREGQLREFLLDEGFIFRRHSQCGAAYYDHYARFAHHFVAKETPVEHTFGVCSHYTLRVTARGVELIQKRLRERRAGLPATA